MCYQTQMPFSFLILFSDIGQCFRPIQTNIHMTNRDIFDHTIFFEKMTVLAEFYLIFTFSFTYLIMFDSKVA